MKKMEKRVGIRSLVLMAVSIFLLVQVQAVVAEDMTNLIVGGRSATMVAGLGKGYFKDEGLKIEIVHLRNFMQYPSMLAAGKIDILDGYLPMNFWNMIDEGADFKIISGGAQCVAAEGNEPARNIRGFVVKKDLYDKGEIREIKDLVGKKVATFAPAPRKGAISPFPVAHRIFGKLYGEIGWIRIPKAMDSLAALEKGDVVAARLRAPWFNLAIKKGIAVELFKETDYFPKMQVTTIAVREKFLKQNRETVIKFLRAYQKALKYINEVQHGLHQDEYKYFNNKYTDIPENVAMELIQAYKYTDEIDRNDLTVMQDLIPAVRSRSSPARPTPRSPTRVDLLAPVLAAFLRHCGTGRTEG